MDAGAGLRVRLLGSFAVEVDGRAVPLSAWRLRKSSELVKVLALNRGHRLPREQLTELLWPDRPADAAANNFHQALHVARAALNAGGQANRFLELRGGLVSLAPDERVSVDVESFEAAARQASSTGDRADFETARQLYTGELLPEDPYLDWLESTRDRLAQEYVSILTDLARTQESAGEREAAIATFRELIALDPADEDAHVGLMQLYARSGRRRLALREFERLRTELGRALDAEPTDESVRAYHEVLEGRLTPVPEAATRSTESTGVTARPPTPPTRPVPVHAGADHAAVPGRTPTRRPNNLPVMLSSFLGRERELREIDRLLLGARVLTLTGTGGAGKTRLAIEAASEQLGRYDDGVWLVELGAVSHGALVAYAVAEVFDIREQADADLTQIIARTIGERNLLIVLDNCEHIVDAAAGVTESLLRGCPNLRILATSRQPLRIPGEVVFRVPSLTLPERDSPDPVVLAGVDSVRLFIERAQSILPTFELSSHNAAVVAEICYHLDGLPLAIELAASRTASLPVATIAERLGDRFRLLVGGSRTALSRQQTLKATLDWSYDLLDERQRHVLRSLSVFVGGAPLEAAEIVCRAEGMDGIDVIGTLGDLVDQSLVVLEDRPEEPRYRLLETVREYGRDRLVESGRKLEVEAAHAAWSLDVAERAEGALPTPAWSEWFERLEVEHDNIRAAIERSLTSDPPRALALAAGMWRFWLWQGHLAEGRRWLARAFDRSAERTDARARALIGAAALAVRSGDLADAVARSEQAEALYGELGDARGRCRALQVMAGAPWSEDDLDGAERDFTHSLEVATNAAFGVGRVAALEGLAIVRWYRGHRTQAKELLDQSLAILETVADSPELVPPMLELGEFVVPEPRAGTSRLVFQETFIPFLELPGRTAAGYLLATRATMDRMEGDDARARLGLKAALELFRSIGDERAIAYALSRLGNLATATGEFARARELLEECLAIRGRIRDSRGIGLAQGNLGNLAIAEGDMTQARALLDDSADGFRRRGDMWGLGSALGNLASLALATGEIEEARQLLESSLAAVRITGRLRWTAWVLVQLAAVSRLAGDAETAATLSAEALEIFVRLADQLGEVEARALGARPGKTDAVSEYEPEPSGGA